MLLNYYYFSHPKNLFLLLIPFLSLSYVVLCCHDKVSSTIKENEDKDHRYWDYIIIGAGPAGLQMGYYLQKARRDYVILERNNISGSFFSTYPRHDKLISINKRYTGKSNKKFNMRHDWNSLLTEDEDDNILFKDFSKDFFPHKDSILEYLSAFADKFQLNIEYGKNIGKIHKDDINSDVIEMEDQLGNIFQCKTLLLATGMWKPNIPDIIGIENTLGYEEISTNPEDFEGKSVLILGKGNTAFETAASVYGSANVVHLVSGSRVRLSWQTHYVGDLRAVNNELLDTYQLKSLDGLLEGPLDQLWFNKVGDKILVSLKDNMTWDNYALREEYDVVIRCLGWTFDDSVFLNITHVCHSSGKISKFPAIGQDYQLEKMQGAYVIGTASHSLDFRKSSGGFIHGFRYVVEALHHILEYRNHCEKWPSDTIDFIDLVPNIIKRVNEGSGIYQMFGVLADVIAINRTSETAEYFKEFPLQLLSNFMEITGYPLKECIIQVLEYGKNFSGPGKDVFYKGRSVGQASIAHKSNFLHPVFYYYKDITSKVRPITENVSVDDINTKGLLPIPDRLHHTVEDFLGVWDGPHTHILPLRRFIEYAIGRDLRQWYRSHCFRLALLSQSLPVSCSEHYIKGEGLRLISSSKK